MNHRQMPVIPQRCDYLMTATFIGVVLLQPPKRKDGRGGEKTLWKRFYLKGEGRIPAGDKGENGEGGNGRFEC